MSDINSEPDQRLRATGFHVRCVITEPLEATMVRLHLDVEHIDTGTDWQQCLELTLEQLRELESLLVITREEIGISPIEPNVITDDPDAP